MKVFGVFLIFCIYLDGDVECKGLREEFTWTRINYVLPSEDNKTTTNTNPRYFKRKNDASLAIDNNYVYGEWNCKVTEQNQIVSVYFKKIMYQWGPISGRTSFSLPFLEGNPEFFPP